ncbi:MAG: hypothetical protein WD648_05705 [Planctomycetaceae bacterium]
MSKPSRIEVTETEAELVATAQLAVSRCNWVVGECAAKWTRKFAKGRSDADFGEQVGLSSDQVYQRRRVWETFGDVAKEYPSLKWSHFYVALNWDDAADCFQWAQENEATVAEMRAWRRATRGDELREEAAVEEWGNVGSAVSFVPTQPTPVRDPGSFGKSERRPVGSGAGNGNSADPAETVATVARESGGDYAPFRKGAGSPAPKDDSAHAATAQRPQVSAGQLVGRITTTLERINAALSPEMLRDIRALPEKQRTRFVKAVGQLSSKAAGLI